MVDTINDISAALQNYIVSPLNAFGLGGFLFDCEGESIATLAADITDHYSEDNRALQDHIALKPKRITLKGYVGEVLYSNPNSSQPITATITQKLTTISRYLPALSAAATQIQQTIQAPSASSLTLTGAANIYGIVKNSIGAFGAGSSQKGAYLYFAACQKEAVLMGIQTPWEFLSNMAIETIIAVQSEESSYITDFAVTFKQIRIASTLTATSLLAGTGGTPPAGGPTAEGACALQTESVANGGVCPGVGLPTNQVPPAQRSIIDTRSLLNNPLANIYRYP